ncbi:hypothetical protein NPIL_383001 [Nephila pilipes]|uniref:Uncharacterized protein n=1 Tax=Nephila pilipes TaxID=299642 RepID=A0A8X6QJF1_NEPPI|nr:hypothetical protein NPIL_383001 [Nephila pilipes]
MRMLGLGNSVLLRNLISSMATEGDFEKIINVNIECIVNTENEATNLVSTTDLESQDNNNTRKKESCIMLEVDFHEIKLNKKNQIYADTTGAIIN